VLARHSFLDPRSLGEVGSEGGVNMGDDYEISDVF